MVDQVGDVRAGAGDLGDLVGAIALDQPEEAATRIDDGEPGPAVAEEVFVEISVRSPALLLVVAQPSSRLKPPMTVSGPPMRKSP